MSGAGTKPVLVTGGAGFIGSNLADRLASAGQHVLVFDALARPGVEANLQWLRRKHPQRISAVIADIRDADAVRAAAADA
ncbi:MAG TPA: SDR family NAD(P)-dependent oxidoreductase, partial [Acetobacteraceae bacterium]